MYIRSLTLYNHPNRFEEYMSFIQINKKKLCYNKIENHEKNCDNLTISLVKGYLVLVNIILLKLSSFKTILLIGKKKTNLTTRYNY